jgi:ketosteroid isomerase-like protein
MNIKALEDSILIRELIDKVSILGDKRDVYNQVQLFSEDAISETYSRETLLLQLKGRKEMQVAFADFLQNFETVYHLNGQQTIILNGDNATGTSYCQVTLIGNENGKKIKTTIGAIYEDDFIQQNNRWLIAKRIGNFQWQEKREINP